MRHKGGRFSLLIVAVLALAVPGCPPPPDHGINNVPRGPKPKDNRPTGEIVRVIHDNEVKLNRALWSSNVAVVAHISDQKGKEHVYNLEGTLLFQRPRNLLINLRPGIGDNVMQVGSNETEYWAWVEPELEQMWWGHHDNVGKPCSQDVFVNPSELVAAMGIGLPSSQSGLLGPFRKNGKHSDLLEYGRQLADGSTRLAQEYRVMRVPPYLVDIVIFYDELGRRAMTASLGDYREAWDAGPLIAHEISVIWPVENNKMSIKIGSFKSFDESKVKPDAFVRPTDSPPLPESVYAHMIQVDADCDLPDRSTDDARQPSGWYGDGTPYYGPIDLHAWPGDDAAHETVNDEESAQSPETP